MKPFLVRLAIVLALGAAGVGLARLAGRDASAGLYVVGAVLVLAALSRGAMVMGTYGEHASVDQIRENNASRAVFLFSGELLLALGVLAEAV